MWVKKKKKPEEKSRTERSSRKIGESEKQKGKMKKGKQMQ
jgi:hypothetical protein